MRPTLSVKPVRTQDAPAADALIADAVALLRESDTWDVKMVKAEATIRRRKADDNHWFCRFSTHKREDVPFDRLWDKLGVQRFPSQKQYLYDVTRVNLIEVGPKNRAVWSAYHSSSSLASPRIFTVLLETRLREYPPHARVGIAVEIPVDISPRASSAHMEERGVKAHAVTIEQIKETNGGATVEWRVITCRDYGGMLPSAVWARQMPDRLIEVTAKRNKPYTLTDTIA
ncbi:hypothetical protein HDZ31DRAFT_66021 [Schizophyllum fasciatum]